MSPLDYVIIAIVVALFFLALHIYRKKPHCSCGEGKGSCSGNCSCCSGCSGCCK